MTRKIALPSLLAAACAGGGTKEHHGGQAEVPANMQLDQEFITDAANGGKFEVESSRVALSKQSTDATTDLAQQLIRDHSQANDKLESLADSKGVDMPEQMSPDQTSKLEQLQAAQGEQFERMFETMQADAHREAIALFERCAKYCQDLDVRQFAADTLPTLQSHMQHVQQMQATAGRTR